jgi:hypothetical protein
MTLTEFIKQELVRLHRALDRAVADLSPEELHRLPPGYNNSIAFIAWHYARTEDNIVRFILQERRPTVWMEGGYAEKLGLPPIAQGTGMSVEDARAFRIDDLDTFKRYVEQVWTSTEEYLANPDESTFERAVLVRPLGEMPAIRALGQVCMTHGFQHLGEIDMLRTMQGKPSAVGG